VFKTFGYFSEQPKAWIPPSQMIWLDALFFIVLTTWPLLSLLYETYADCPTVLDRFVCICVIFLQI